MRLLRLLPALSLTLATPAFAEPLSPTAPAFASEAPTPAEGSPTDAMPTTRVAGVTIASFGGALTLAGAGIAIAGAVVDPSHPSEAEIADLCAYAGDQCDIRMASDETYGIAAGITLGTGLTAALVGLIMVSLPAPATSDTPSAVSLELGAGSLGVRGSF
jgi:hypothetical protein